MEAYRFTNPQGLTAVPNKLMKYVFDQGEFVFSNPEIADGRLRRLERERVKRLSVFVLLALRCLLISFSGCEAPMQTAELTDEFRDFLEMRAASDSAAMRDSAGDYGFSLESGRLSVVGTDGDEIWRSNEEWHVDTFRIGDINRDGILDLAFVVWKSYSFGNEHPARMANGDASVRCHLFVYSIKDNLARQLWCSSNLPRPIYSFELDENGEQTPTLSGVLLVTQEGAYTDDYRKTLATEYVYAWNSWGFSPVDESASELIAAGPGAVEVFGERSVEESIDKQIIADHGEVAILRDRPVEESADKQAMHATLAAVGDLMCHEPQYANALEKGGGEYYDFSHAFKHIAPYIQEADYAIGNFETTITLPGNQPSDFPRFASPYSFAEAIKEAGFDFVATANNHALDFGVPGLLHTLQALDEIGLDHTGAYETEEDSDEIKIVNVNGISFAFLSYTYGTNGNPLPPDSPWHVNDREKALSDIAKAKELNPDIIIVMPHIGIEYDTAPRQVMKDEVYELVRAGADVVLVTHPHVLQPVEYVTITDDDGTERHAFVAYSLGNFISSQRTHPRDYGMIAYLRFSKEGEEKAVLDSVDLAPTWVRFRNAQGKHDIAILPIGDLDKPELADIAKELRVVDVERIQAIEKEFGEMFGDNNGE